MTIRAVDSGAWQRGAVELRRERIVRAMAKLACENGFAGVSVALLCAEAGVSRSRFYELFESREACFLAVLEEGRRRAHEIVSHAFAQDRDWLDGGRIALAELLLFFDAEPALARVCLVESLAAGPWALERREQCVMELTRRVVAQWGASVPEEPHPHTNVGLMAAMLGVVQNHLLADRQEPMIGLLGPLVGLATAPYLDAQAVAEQVKLAGALTDKLLATRSADVTRDSVELPDLLLNPQAHRSRRCVLYLTEHPGASNREIARAVGIARDTHISTMLSRLAQSGVLVKQSGPPGGANAWTLTPYGLSAARVLHNRFTSKRTLQAGRTPQEHDVKS